MQLKTTVCFCLALVAMALQGQSPSLASLNTNRVKAVVNANGALFTDLQKGQFIAPYAPGQPELSLLRAAGLWIVGTDPAGNLKGAAQLYNTDGKTDFYPGQLDETGAPGTPALTGIYRVTRTEVETHLADFADNGVIDNPQPGVFGWPGRGNPHFFTYHGQDLPFTQQGLAGFYDRNEDGVYTPEDGDFPANEVRGCALDGVPDEMLWFVFHDVGPHTQSGMAPIRIEIQCQVFAYGCSEESPLRNTVFVRYKLINRNTEELTDLYTGLFNDFEIGHPGDDFFGTDPARQLVFGYNGDANDEGGYGAESPALGVDMFRGPLDVFGEEVSLKHVVSFQPAQLNIPEQYYYLVQGRFADGMPAPNNGIQFPGNPNDPDADTEVSAGSTPGQRQVVASYGPFTLLPGAVNELIAGYVYTQEPGNTALQNVQAMYQRSDQIQAFLDNCFTAGTCAALVDAPVVPDAAGLRLYPNPASQRLSIESQDADLTSVRLFDLAGRELYCAFNVYPQAQMQVPLESLAAGMYTAVVGRQNQVLRTEKVVVLK